MSCIRRFADERLPGGPSRRRRLPAAWLVALGAVLALGAPGCTDDGRPPLLSGHGEGAAATELRAGLGCDELVELTALQLRAAAAATTGTFAQEDGSAAVAAGEAGGDAAMSREAPTTVAAGDAGGEVVAGTNVQEQGVDEPDLVKTDGRRIVALVDGTLRVVELDGDPAVDGEVRLAGDEGSPFVDGAGGGRLFLRGDEALVLLPHGVTGPAEGALPVEAVRILRVDLSRASQPTVVEEVTVEGSLAAARMVDGTARVVLRSPVPAMTRMWAEGPDEVLADLGADDVLPRLVRDGVPEPLVPCEEVSVLTAVDDRGGSVGTAGGSAGTAEPNTVTVLTIGDGLGDLAPTTVSGLADIVYASTGAMYVTSTGWGGTGPVTFVHRFELPVDGRAVHTGSGQVPGAPLSQYALSEAEGDLRIVTTTEDAAAPAEGPVGDAIGPGGLDAPVAQLPATEGRLAVLRPAEDGSLREVGHLEDLGVGERVQSVRFLGPMAYVVTFRQTDPLYAIDLSDPTTPRALGELKITGFSEYLHPVGDGLLLGVGREATEDGMDTGLKASLFDVSDPTAPRELDKVVVEAADSPVGQDPLAFTWDPVGSQAVIPLHHWGSPDLPVADCGPGLDCGLVAPAGPAAPAGPRSGALVLAVGGGRLEEVAELSHDDGGDPWRSEILRSVVVDRDLWTVSRLGLGRTDAEAPGGVELLGW